MDDLKFTTAGEYADWYYNGTLEERYASYVELADEGDGTDRYTGEPVLSFDEWLNA